MYIRIFEMYGFTLKENLFTGDLVLTKGSLKMVVFKYSNN
jgi:hypothetical protein